jgi:DNA-binding NarL/FixJ family response regulator
MSELDDLEELSQLGDYEIPSIPATLSRPRSRYRIKGTADGATIARQANIKKSLRRRKAIVARCKRYRANKLAVAQIATELGISQHTVRHHIREARKDGSL